MSRSDLIPYGALLLRVSLGTLFLAHGLLKLLVFKPAGTAAYFRSLGLPGFVGYLTIAAELGGGTLLILGIATSLVAVALVPLSWVRLSSCTARKDGPLPTKAAAGNFRLSGPSHSSFRRCWEAAPIRSVTRLELGRNKPRAPIHLACPHQILSGKRMMKLSRLGIFTCGSVLASITSFSPMILLSAKM
jgi:hypothetical protein